MQQNDTIHILMSYDPNDSPPNNMIQLERTEGYGNYEGSIVYS